MRSSKVSLAAIAALALALSSGCRATIPDAWFGCSADSECPPGQSCSAGVCRSGATGGDAGVPDGGVDGGVDGGPVCDDELFCNGVEVFSVDRCLAGEPPCGEGPCDEATDACGEPSPITVRFVHASYRLGPARFAVDGLGDVSLSYGEVSAPLVVPGPTDGSLEAIAEVTGIRIAETFGPAPSVLVVLGPRSADEGDVLYVLPDDLVPNGETATFRYHNLMAAHDAIAVRESIAGGGAAATPLALGASGAVQDAAPAGAGSFGVGVEIFEVSGGVLLDETLAGFVAPLDRSAWVLLFGDLRRHFGDPLGPAVMVLDDSPEPMAPDALTHVMNATLSTMTVCLLENGSRVGSFQIDAGQLSPGISFPPLDNLSMGFGLTDADACASMSMRMVLLAALPTRRRHLIAVTGAAAAPLIYTLSELAWDGVDRSEDTQLVFAHYAPIFAPGPVELAISDSMYNPIFSGVMAGQHYATYVDRVYLQGTVDLTAAGARSTYTVTPADTTDTLFFLYSDAGSAPILRSVTAPFGRSWLAGAR